MRRTRQSSGGQRYGVLAHRFVDRRAYMCLTARTLAMTGKNNASLRIGGRASASGTCVKGRCATNGKVLSTYTVTAREAHLCGERGSPAAGKV